MEAGDGLIVATLTTGQSHRMSLDDHSFMITATADVGIHTGRRRYAITCETCEYEVHKATTGPWEMMRSHIDSSRRYPPTPKPAPTPKPIAKTPPNEKRPVPEGVTAVKPVESYVEGDRLVQVFEYVSGPQIGERFKLVSRMFP